MLTDFPLHQYVQYKMYKHKDTMISSSIGTDCFELEGRFGIVRIIVDSTGGTHVVYELCERKGHICSTTSLILHLMESDCYQNCLVSFPGLQ